MTALSLRLRFTVESSLGDGPHDQNTFYYRYRGGIESGVHHAVVEVMGPWMRTPSVAFASWLLLLGTRVLFDSRWYESRGTRFERDQYVDEAHLACGGFGGAFCTGCGGRGEKLVGDDYEACHHCGGSGTPHGMAVVEAEQHALIERIEP